MSCRDLTVARREALASNSKGIGDSGQSGGSDQAAAAARPVAAPHLAAVSAGSRSAEASGCSGSGQAAGQLSVEAASSYAGSAGSSGCGGSMTQAQNGSTSGSAGWCPIGTGLSSLRYSCAICGRTSQHRVSMVTETCNVLCSVCIHI